MRIPSRLHRALKIACAERGVSLQDAMVSAVEWFVGGGPVAVPAAPPPEIEGILDQFTPAERAAIVAGLRAAAAALKDRRVMRK